METLSKVNAWIGEAESLIAREAHIPLIDDFTIDMTDDLEDAWKYGDDSLRTAIENILSRDPNHLAARFIALNVYYRLMTLAVPESEEDAAGRRDVVRKHLGYLVRLRDKATCTDVRTIRWEITNACATRDYERAFGLCDQLHGILPDHEVLTARARLHFLIGFHQTLYDDDILAIWDLPIGDATTGFRKLINAATTMVLYTLGLQQITPRRRVTDDEKLHLRDATNTLEKALAIDKEIPPSARLILARSYDAIGDGHHAARVYEQILKHNQEFLKECARESEPVWAQLNQDAIPSLYACLSHAYEHDGDLTKAITTTNNWIAAYPEQLGTYERLARLHQKCGDYQTAYAWLRKEADRNPNFGEDPNISIALALGSTGPGYLDEQLNSFSRDHKAELQLIATVISQYWPTFQKMAPEIKERWVIGAHFLTGDRLQPGIATHCFAWVIERELRMTILECYAATTKQRPGLTEPPVSEDEAGRLFTRYLKGTGTLGLGQMLKILERAPRAPSRSSLAPFAQWLKERHQRLLLQLGLIPTSTIIALRNREDHADPRTITRADAETMAHACQDLLTALHNTG